MTDLDPGELRRLHLVADVLVPANERMPSLAEADPDGLLLLRTLSARSDLAPRLKELLAALDEADLPDHLRSLFDRSRADFDVLATFVAGPYFMSPHVRELIGYPGQRRNRASVDEAMDDLEGVLEQASGYRPRPRGVD